MKAIAASLLILTAFGTVAARAADILDAPMIYQDAPELQPVEIGNGWYIRGDVSYDMKSDLDTSYSVFADDGTTGPIVIGEGEDGLDLKDGFAFGVGFGYRFTDFLRGDLTASRWEKDVDGLEGDAIGLSSEVEAWELMTNVYADLGTFAGFTPYVGAGAGAVHTKFSAECASGTIDCNLLDNQETSSNSDWRFAYALMAGVSYDLTADLKLDAGYRFVSTEGGKTFSYQADVGPGSVGATVEDDGFDRHTVQVGLRYSLW
ncbi:outer membrane protein [Mangrovicella endophytica]|uniref:outer membrane protein n=1 Tax=Mangrovicella endophytica TaxID=2066697 RepID=UPI000C9DDF27|nr:outer membrane protein [Mangrovicella endophytica]